MRAMPFRNLSQRCWCRFLSVWLFPRYEQDSAYVTFLAQQDLNPLTVPPSATDKQVADLLALQKAGYDRQHASFAALDAKRDALLTRALGLVTLASAAVGFLDGCWLLFAPAVGFWLLASVYLLWCRRAVDIPAMAFAADFFRHLPPGTSDREFDLWVADQYCRAEAAARAYSLVVGRHINVASLLLLLGLAAFGLAAFAAAIVRGV